MKMNAQTVRWFLFLALIKNFSFTQDLFDLPDSALTAKEGSCTEIKCRVKSRIIIDDAHWFWMKNGHWNGSYFIATIIYSSNESKRPVSPDYKGRVEYIGSPSSSWGDYSTSQKPLCSILICDLKKTDSGLYSFRFAGKDKHKWVTKNLTLTVTENPCPITFEKPAVVKESDMITLTCSTLHSCPLNLEIKDLTQPSLTLSTNLQQPDEKQKRTKLNFTANWLDDGRNFSCQTKDNTDTYLIRNINVTVEYAPKDIKAFINTTTNIKEGESVTLICSAKGRPTPTFNWFKNNQTVPGPVWKIDSINETQSGEYLCEAHNTIGRVNSSSVNVTVTYVPQVEVNTSHAYQVKEGDKITLTCNVKKSKPKPHSYTWIKDKKPIHWSQTYVRTIEPEDGGLYKCSAINSAGTGTSKEIQIEVEYRPRKTVISINRNDRKVKVDSHLTFTCDTDANPGPMKYSWSRDGNSKQIPSSQWEYKTSVENELSLEHVQRTDEACYRCNATNTISTGWDSKPLCIEVLYPPTIPMLSMDTEVTEGQFITISCTVESFPPSQLKLIRTSEANAQSSDIIFSQTSDLRPYNTLHRKFSATSAHTGSYTCSATNSEGSKTSEQRKLVVKYSPKDVTVDAKPNLTVNENTLLTLSCNAHSYPKVTSVTWKKMTLDGQIESTQETDIIKVQSVSPSDSGRYKCTAGNEIGTGDSELAVVKVNYAPKNTKITRAAEQQRPGGIISVMLSCSSESYPPIKEYRWYKKIEEKDEYKKLSDSQNFTVYSHQPGLYRCTARNEINVQWSDPVPLFVNRGLMWLLFLFLGVLVIILIFFVYRHKRNKLIRQRTTNKPPCYGFMGWWNCARRGNLMNELVTTQPSRSTDDILPDQPCRPMAQQRQPRPDSTPASNINSVYCTVNLPTGNKGPSAQKSMRQQGGTWDEALNYASLHFKNKQNKPAKAEEDTVYAMVSKQKPPKKNEKENQDDYENISAVHAATSPDPLNYDTDTSEDEAEINYTQVSIKAKPGHQRACRDSSTDSSTDSGTDSSTSDEEETQYSEVKI
ncbi:hemicentin-2 [Dicentrarchus labrax]|uniref:B-cell receptor CD22 n=2 Tax=Dicentrarchus labrax TaxID=13489 RepID=A0A8C4DD71_DICLA|nr:hemicentin-2 [Dicentrarchus labrax]